MITRIGITAGDIWELLDKSKEVKLSKLFSNFDDSRDLILMSLGWLVREGYVMLKKDKQDYRLSLKKVYKKKTKDIKCPYLQGGKQSLCLVCLEVMMAPSIDELAKFCLSGQYESCPWRQKQELRGREV